jgi:hypothetical protein
LRYLAFEILKSARSDSIERDDQVIYPDVIIDRVAKMFKLSKNEIEKYALDSTDTLSNNEQNLLIEKRIVKSEFCKSELLSKYFGITYKPTSVFINDIPISTVLDDYLFNQTRFLTDDL